MARHLMSEQDIVTAWTPDLFGPIFKKESLTLKKVFDLRNADEQIHLMATFVPDELIYNSDLLRKSFHSFQAVLMYLNIPHLTLFKKYFYDKNGGSLDLTAMLNEYIHIVVNEVYCSDGDILKFSADGVLAMWKVCDGEFMFNIVQNVIIHAMNIQNSIAALKNDDEIPKVNVAISAGDVMFSIIGNEESRHFVIIGSPIEQLKHVKKISMPSDLILSLSAWQYCTPSQYEYVIKDPYNIKILKLLEQSDANLTSISSNDSKDDHIDINLDYETFINRKFITKNSIKTSTFYKARVVSINNKLYSEIFANVKKKVSTAISTIAATNPNFGTLLKSYLIKPVVQQIEKSESLQFLADVRRITIMFLDIIPNKCSETELILLVDKCFLLLHSIVTQYAGCINMVNLYDKNILFCVVFGICGSNDEDQFKIDETCKNGIICAMHVLQAVKNINEIQSVFVGVSTGMAYCGVVGHVARKYYAIIGPSVNKAIKLMDISYNKISCDYDTVLHSHLNKNQFRSRGMRTFNQFEKYHIYEYLGDMPLTNMRKDLDATLSLDYCYPILGRMQELECFNNILDEIGVPSRNYSGLLIEGKERSGKSRLLDAFVTNVCNRKIKPIKLSVHVTYADKAYAVIYHIILQLFQADDSDTVEERQKALLLKLGDVLALEDFCYLNTLLRVRFPISHTYCSDSEWQRHMKTINIFKTILKQVKTKICILLDDVQHIDYKSWQFLSSALDNDNVVVAMTMLKIDSREDLSQAKIDICKDSRIMQRILLDLDLNLLPALICQFLNVLAIPKILNRILQKRKDDYIGWCELYLTLLLQSNSLDFIKISPNEAKRHDLIFPDASLVTKLPIDLTPEELAPPSSWSQMNHLDVCVLNENYFKMLDTNHDLKDIIREIYNRMNPYEQSLITCAATLGLVFKRNALQNVMLNEIPPHTTNAISQMFRMRILECAALQRRDFRTDVLTFCIDKKRSTFSDMHHLLSCHCNFSQQSASGYCKMLEFKFNLFCNVIYDTQSSEERKQHHARAVRIYNRDAQKCICCDGGSFLRIPSKDIIVEKEPTESSQMSSIHNQTFNGDQNDKSTSRRQSISFARKIAATKRQEPIITRRISIMPTYLDVEDKVSRNQESKESLISESLKFWKQQTSVTPKTMKEPSHSSCLEQFGHIDYRDCQCDSIISYLFWKLHKHIEQSGSTNEVINFLLEYSAGLMQIAQSLYAVKLLLIAAEKNEAAEKQIGANAENNTNKGIILALTGDAYRELGNYAEAKKYYIEAMKLRGTPPKTNKAACYNIILKMYYTSQDFFRHMINNVPRHLVVKNLEFASYLRRVCVIYMMEDKLKIAQLFALRSFKLALLNIGGFLEKGEIYLATVRVLHRTKNIKLIKHIERLMLTVINIKLTWNDAEELVMVANIYLTMYQIRALRGELEEAVDMGNKALKICRVLHHDKMMLDIMPSLIQIMLWTKRINEAIDLMRELYFLAEDDVDLSSKIWYYALSLEFILDAGIVLESYRMSYNYYMNVVRKPKSCVWRDPESLCRLSICLGIYQLRMGYTVTVNAFAHRTEEYTKDISWDHFSRIFSCSKRLEYYLLTLLRRINIKHSNQLLDLIEDIYKVIKCLRNVSNKAVVVKPHFYLLMAYLNVLRGRKSTTRYYLREAQKFAISQGNKLIMAWIMQNRRTWKKEIYNNMARYWLEYIGSTDIVAWQYIRDFDIDIWSTILYPLPTPNSYL